MYFTAIISAYKCEKTINRLLNSLVNQNEPELQIIIIDDSYYETFYSTYIQKYENKLNIKYYPRRNELYKYHCPGNTRHDGLLRALNENTEYIFFIDCDDELEPNMLPIIKKELKKESLDYVYTTFYEYLEDNPNQPIREQTNRSWLHGNFYKKNFLLYYNINFKIDLTSNEDVYFANLIGAYLVSEKIVGLELPYKFYKWYNRENSTSHNMDYGDYTEVNYQDFLIASSEPYLKILQLYPEKKEEFLKAITLGLLSGYFYIQAFLFFGHYEAAKNSYNILKQHMLMLIEKFHIPILKFINIINTEPEYYMIDKKDMFMTYGGSFIEQKSFKDFFLDMNIDLYK